MLQYLFNATCIWLLSLLVFEALLRRESYHAYNRLYLLATLLLGLLLPLWQWPAASYSYASPALQQSVVRVLHAKQALNLPAITAQTQSVNMLTIIYLAGLCIALGRLLLDIARLLSYFKHTRKTKQGNWTIIETGKGHAPFSFFNTLFVSSIQQYDDGEWQMILNHEARHARLLHFADLALMQLCSIIFWFHPLVYAYSRRLILVHEYQADQVAAAQQIKVYGTFLITQAMLAAAPRTAHSFNRSPIKNRLIMLTRTSSASSKGKMFLLLPITAVCIICFSKNSIAGRPKQQGNSITNTGNVVILSKQKTDTVILTDPVTGKEETQIVQMPPRPVKVNGKEIQNMEPSENGLFPAAIANSNERYFTYLSEGLRPLLEKLDDGKYSIGAAGVVINEKGDLAYYELQSIALWADPIVDSKRRTMDTKLQESINKKTTYLLAHCPKFEVYKVNGKPMPYAIGNFNVTVKYHQLNAM